jgi:adenine-specific DNA-methyltransferase
MSKNDYINWSKEELIEEIKKLRTRRKYGLVWDTEREKEKVVELCKENLPVIVEDKGKGIQTDESKPINILIEGDNYHALSVLNYTHKGKIDVIYIDPPYNTGNGEGFIYNDKLVDREDSFRHSKWISFMNKRLKLARNLLKNKGIIFISIDDNEVAQLKLLCNEIFREENFIAQLIWKKKAGGGSDAKYFAIDHEYILVYAKNEKYQNRYFVELTEKLKADYKYKDANFKKLGPYKRKNLYQTGIDTNRPNLKYEIECPDGKKILPPTIWRWSKETFIKAKNEGKIDFVKNGRGEWQVFTKMYLYGEEGEEYQIKPRSILLDVGLTKDGTNEIKNIFGEKVFDYPKPTTLIEFIISVILESNETKKGLILDFFAGTGTTGNAVLELNKADKGNRQFILCTDNENNICTDVCYPRINKIIKGYKNSEGEEVIGLGGNLKYFRTGFVGAEPTDKNKVRLTKKATEMLCLKEGTFERVVDKEEFKIFKNKEKSTGIIFDHSYIQDFKEVIKKMDGKFSVYVFSLGGDTFDEEFEDLMDRVELTPIPESILNTYRKIFR